MAVMFLLILAIA